MRTTFLSLFILVLSCISYSHCTQSDIVVTHDDGQSGMDILSHDGTQPNVIVEPQIIKYSRFIQVKWFNISNPTINDILRIHAPASKPISPIWEPFDVIQISRHSKTWEKGFGSIKLQVPNIRVDFDILYIRNPTLIGLPTEAKTRFVHQENGEILARSNIVHCQTNVPTQIRLSFTDKEDEMRIMFSHVEENHHAARIEYGLTSGVYIWNLTDEFEISTYSINEMCDSPANTVNGIQTWWPPHYTYDSVFKNLKPSQMYYYRVCFKDECTPEYSFMSRKTDHVKQVKFIALGDLGIGNPAGEEANWNFERILRDYSTGEYDFVLHVGDISYARGSAIDWEYFMSMITPLSSSAPYMVSIGNHEYCYPGQPFKPEWANYGTDSDGECGVPFIHRFHMNDYNPGTKRNLWYSFTYAKLIHLIVFSGEHDFLPGSPQYEWLENDIASVNRTETPWLIVATHRAMYTSCKDEGDSRFSIHFREYLEPLLLKYKVDLFIAGHLHQAERSCAVAHGECVNQDYDHPHGAPVHVVIGNAGFLEPFKDEQPDWSVFRVLQKGYFRVSATNEELKMEMIGAREGGIHDEFTIRKE